MTGAEASYHVLIPYREPTYELRRPAGPRGEPFVSELTVRAASEAAAIEEAIRLFRERALASSVAWVREIDHEGIRVARLDLTP